MIVGLQRFLPASTGSKYLFPHYLGYSFFGLKAHGTKTLVLFCSVAKIKGQKTVAVSTNYKWFPSWMRAERVAQLYFTSVLEASKE